MGQLYDEVLLVLSPLGLALTDWRVLGLVISGVEVPGLFLADGRDFVLPHEVTFIFRTMDKLRTIYSG